MTNGLIHVRKIAWRAIAYRLGEDSEGLRSLVEKGLVIPGDDGTFEVISQEVHRSGSAHGERARIGDYVKVDGSGFPYPQKAAWFEANHRHISGDEYEQIPRVLSAWRAGDPIGPEIRFLMEHRGLILCPENYERYFTAPLWGTMESAAGDAVIVFYSLQYGADGTVEDAAFNFVAGDEFAATYEYC